MKSLSQIAFSLSHDQALSDDALIAHIVSLRAAIAGTSVADLQTYRLLRILELAANFRNIAPIRAGGND